MNYSRLKNTLAFGTLVLFLLLSTTFIAGPNESSPTRRARSLPEKYYDPDVPKFTFEDIFGSKFSYRTITPTWISGNQYTFQNYDILLRNVTSMKDEVLMPGSVYYENYASSYKISSTQEYIALLTNYVKGWRHTYNGSYLIYDVQNMEFLPSNTFPDDIQYFRWSPDRNALAYVRGFDIYYREEPTGPDVQITYNGRANHIYNGIPDWVYEEEMISSNNVIYFSPDGKMLAFAQFDDTPCQHIEFVRYDEQQYPSVVDVSYPKAGTVQPTNKVFVYDIQRNISTEIQPTTQLAAADYLFNRVTWANESRFAVTWSDRVQTWSVTRLCDFDEITPSWNCQDSPTYEHKTTTGWLYQRRPYWIPVFGRTADEYFTVLPNEKWQHLARVDKNEKISLTNGTYTVTSESASYPSVYFYDHQNDFVYFLATLEGPGKRQVYRVHGHEPQAPQCITCPLAAMFPDRCQFVTASFSTDGTYTVVRCRGEGPPLQVQYRVDGQAIDVEKVLVDMTMIEANEDLVDAVASTQMSSVSHGTIQSSTGTFYYEQWNPPNFDKGKIYPLLIDVYAGPGYQNVDYLWTRSWAPRYVPVALNAVVVRIDGRGSNFYGDEFMHEVYQNLGQKEIEDQIEAARYFGNQPYINESNIAIWGWSYGGFATSHAVGLGTDIIKCGLAVAPLTDWRYYDTIYAERYMSTPSENPEGYDKANIMNKAENFKKSRYYLIHGTADDNVHFQNAAELEKTLVNHDVSFRSFFYADQAHSINQGNAGKHVYKILTTYLSECFELPVPDDIWPINS